jgi:soluble lytic murein transglycosylase-like protein
MRAEMELSPDVLRDVVKEGGGEIAYHQNGAECREKHQHVAVTTLTERTLTLPRKDPLRRIAPPLRSPLPGASAARAGLRLVRKILPLVALVALAACGAPAPAPFDEESAAEAAAGVRVERLLQAALVRPGAPPRAGLEGARFVIDAPSPAPPVTAVARSIMRANRWIGPTDALEFAAHAIAEAHRQGLPYGFFCATILQESGFDPGALSSAGAVGIAQFTLDTARGEGVDPFDWRSAVGGAARLLARYAGAYGGVYKDPYAAALAAYNAGPGAVARYRGVPPYPETREYIADIYDRWSRIERDANGTSHARAPL